MVELDESLSRSASEDWKERFSGDVVSDGKEPSGLKDGMRRLAKETLLLILRKVGDGEKSPFREFLRSPGVTVFGVAAAESLGDLVGVLHVIISQTTCLEGGNLTRHLH